MEDSYLSILKVTLAKKYTIEASSNYCKRAESWQNGNCDHI